MPEELQNQQMNNPVSASPTMNPANAVQKPAGKNSSMKIIVGITVVNVLIAIFVAWRLLSSGESVTYNPTNVNTSANTIPAVTKVSDLDKLESQLNSTNFSDIENDLKQNDTDAAGF